MAEDITRAYGFKRAMAVACDVTREGTVQAAFALACRAYGGVDIVVNN